MGYSIRTFLITPDDVIRKIGMTHYWNMLGTPNSDCVPEFADQRVRLANLTIELVDRKPVHVINRDFVIVTFDAGGRLNVGQIMQRGSSLFEVFMASNLGPLRQERHCEGCRCDGPLYRTRKSMDANTGLEPGP